TRKEDSTRQPERGIERLIERGLEPRYVDTEIGQEPTGHLGPLRARRIDRLAAAIADHQAAIDRELVALGVTAEIVVIVEHEDARLRPHSTAVEPCGREPADAAADHDQVITLFGW